VAGIDRGGVTVDDASLGMETAPIGAGTEPALKVVAVDFETANEDRFSPCAIGLAWIEGGMVTRCEYRLIRPPEMRFSVHNVRVHGIRPEDVDDAPEFPDVLSEFLPDIAGGLLLAHNAAFDIQVLCATLALYGKPIPEFSYLCTLLMARRSWPQERKFGLAALALRLGFAFQHHHAGEDARACARVALAAAELGGAADIPELGARLMLQAGRVEAGAILPCGMLDGSGRPSAARVYPKRPHRLDVAAAGDDRLRFVVRGSTGNRYEIVGRTGGGVFLARCGCIAGQNRRRCRHVAALLDGDITELLSDNSSDVGKLRGLVHSAASGSAAWW
jgi:DNA polymerase-3 subunit epsilon